MTRCISNNRMWAIALRNGTLDSNAGRNVKRSADVWGNARHFCDCELNYIGCESSHPTTQDKRKDISKFADVLFRILFSILRLLTSCSWTQAHRPDVHFLICPHDFFKVLCVISVQWFGPDRSPSYPYFCANMVTNLILIRLPFSSVLCSWPKSSLYLCNVQPA